MLKPFLKVLSTHLLNADALIIVLVFSRFLLRIVGSLLSCRCLIFKVRFRPIRAVFSSPSFLGARLYYHILSSLSTLFLGFLKFFSFCDFIHYILSFVYKKITIKNGAEHTNSVPFDLKFGLFFYLLQEVERTYRLQYKQHHKYGGDIFHHNRVKFFAREFTAAAFYFIDYPFRLYNPAY